MNFLLGIKGINTEIAQRLVDILKPHGKIYITSERSLEPQFEQYRIKINQLDMHHVMAFEQISENQFRKLIAHIKKEVLIDDETMDEIEAGVPVERTELSPVINITQNGPKSIAQVINSGTSIINL